MCISSVRSFGIIGGGAVLFTATSLAGQAILPAVGDMKFFRQEIKTQSFRHWRSSGSSRRNSSHLFSSILHRKIWSVLFTPAGEAREAQMSTGLLVRPARAE